MTSELELTDLPIIDIEAALKSAGNNKEIAAELLALLCKTLQEDVSAIKQAFSDNQQKELLQRVHKLHGGVSYCGLPRLKKLLMRIESNLKKNEVRDLHLLLDQLANEANQVLELQIKQL
jgi:two-component system, NarL family, sensor histidine kinase BarA